MTNQHEPAVAPDGLPAVERRDKELGFTVTPSSHQIIKLAAQLSRKKLATYLRDVIEADAARVIAQWQTDRGAA